MAPSSGWQRPAAAPTSAAGMTSVVQPEALSVVLFGPPLVRFATEERPLRADRRHQLLAYLAYRDDWQTRAHLAELFWRDSDEASASRNLRQLLHRARQLPWAQGLQIDPVRVRWRVATDVAALRAAAADGDLPALLDLARGPLMQNLEGYEQSGFAEWLELQRQQDGATVRDALLSANDADADAGSDALAAAAAERALALDPYDEEAVLRLLRLGQRGHQPDLALRAYEDHARRLRQELGLEPVSEVRRVADALRAAHRGGRRGRRLSGGSGDAPALAREAPHASTFVGRADELAVVIEGLLESEGRLVSVTGPSGIGKTRLAYEVGRLIAGHFHDGCFAVPLLDTATTAGVPMAIANAIGYRPAEPDSVLNEVTAHLSGRRLLLILDNLEHLLAGDAAEPGAAPLLAETVARLLDAVPGLAVLATSHERLGLGRERIVPISGLAAPRRGGTSESVLASEAVQLFIERATRLDHAFELQPGEEHLVLDICLLVEGSPLGIELAAAASRHYSLLEIARGLEASGLELSSVAADAPKRHRSLRAAFDYTWSLLLQAEGDGLARLAAFRGGFTRAAAAYVAGVPSTLLASFVDRSLVTRTGPGRFDVHPLLRRFLGERLSDMPGEPTATHARHLDYYAAVLDEPDSRAAGSAYGRWHDTVAADADNYQAALERAVERGATSQGLTMAGRLSHVWTALGYLRQGIGHIEALLAAAADDAGRRGGGLAAALTTAGSMSMNLGDLSSSESYLRRALEAAETAGDEATAVRASVTFGALAFRLGRYDFGRDLLTGCLARLEPDANPNLRIRLLNNLGAIEIEAGDGVSARRWLLEGLAEARAQGDRYLITLQTFNLGWAARLCGELAEARTLLAEAARTAPDTSPAQLAASIVNALAIVELLAGDLDAATRLAREAAQARAALEDRFGLAFSFEGLAAVAAARREFGRAATLLGAASALREAIRSPLPAGWTEHVDAARESATAELGAAAFQEGFAAGREMSLPAAIAMAVQ